MENNKMIDVKEVKADPVQMATQALESCRKDLEAERQRVATLEQAVTIASPSEIVRLRDQLATGRNSVADLEALLQSYQRDFDTVHDLALKQSLVEGAAQLTEANAKALAEWDVTYAQLEEALGNAERDLLHLATLQKVLDGQAQASHAYPGCVVGGREYDWSFQGVTPAAGMGLAETHHWVPPQPLRDRVGQILGR